MDIKAIEKAKELIKEFEGLQLESYYCAANIRTIGWGHVIRHSDNIDATITLKKAETLLDQDIKIADSCLYRNTLDVHLNHNQRAALISFIFNLGGAAFQSSTLRQKLLRSEYALATNEFTRWVYVNGKKLRGLERRRKLEQELFTTPVTSKIIYPSILAKFKEYLFAYAKA